jgi:integrase/recombinase XerD
VAESIPLPRIERYLPETMNELQIDRLLDGVDVNAPRGLRDRAILELLYASGLRVSELVNAKLEFLDLDNRIIRVTGKGQQDAIVPVGRRRATPCAPTRRETSGLRDETQRQRDFLSLARRRKLTTVRVWQIVKAGREARRARSQRLSRTCCATASPRTC